VVLAAPGIKEMGTNNLLKPDLLNLPVPRTLDPLKPSPRFLRHSLLLLLNLVVEVELPRASPLRSCKLITIIERLTMVSTSPGGQRSEDTDSARCTSACLGPGDRGSGYGMVPGQELRDEAFVSHTLSNQGK
jgi:hypothetical protein